MKPRKVMIHLELSSTNPLSLLKNKEIWQDLIEWKLCDELHQVTVQVVKEKK